MKKIIVLFLFFCLSTAAQQSLGSFAEDDTIHFMWTTVDSTGEPVTRSTDGTVSVYRDNGTTQSTAGITDTEDFDGLTGVHAVTIDLSADAFYTANSDYTVTINGAVVDGVTLNAPIAYFTIENEYMRGTDGANTTTPPTVGQIRTEMETAGGNLALILQDTGTTLPGTLSGLATSSDLATAQVDISSILADTDQLQIRLAAMIEADGADWRFDANALELAPGGDCGDATAANQTTIINHLTDIKGATWSSTTDSLEAIANAISALDVGAGNGDTLVTHNTGGTDELRVVDGNGNGIQDCAIVAYVKSAYDSNPLTATVQATATTAADGRWESPYMMLDTGTTYTLYIYKPGVYGPATADITP